MVRILSLVAGAFIIISCQKRVENIETNPPAQNLVGDLLIKSFSVGGSTRNDTSTVTYSWDRNRMFSGMHSVIFINGVRHEMRDIINRRADGRIDSVVGLFNAPYSKDTAVYTYFYKSGQPNSQINYVRLLRKNINGFSLDSFHHIYNSAGQIAALEKYAGYPYFNTYTPIEKREYEYDAAGNRKTVKLYASIFGGPFSLTNVYSYEFGVKKPSINMGMELAVLGYGNASPNNLTKATGRDPAGNISWTSVVTSVIYNSAGRPVQELSTGATSGGSVGTSEMFYEYQ